MADDNPENSPLTGLLAGRRAPADVRDPGRQLADLIGRVVEDAVRGVLHAVVANYSEARILAEAERLAALSVCSGCENEPPAPRRLN